MNGSDHSETETPTTTLAKPHLLRSIDAAAAITALVVGSGVFTGEARAQCSSMESANFLSAAKTTVYSKSSATAQTPCCIFSWTCTMQCQLKHNLNSIAAKEKAENSNFTALPVATVCLQSAMIRWFDHPGRSGCEASPLLKKCLALLLSASS